MPLLQLASLSFPLLWDAVLIFVADLSPHPWPLLHWRSEQQDEGRGCRAGRRLSSLNQSILPFWLGMPRKEPPLLLLAFCFALFAFHFWVFVKISRLTFFSFIVVRHFLVFPLFYMASSFVLGIPDLDSSSSWLVVPFSLPCCPAEATLTRLPSIPGLTSRTGFAKDLSIPLCPCWPLHPWL